MADLEVNCYSGHTYAERPLSFTWQGIGYKVKEVEKAWQEPGERCFLVKTGDNKSFQLCYNEANDEWSITKPAKEQGNAKRNSKNTGR
jgi:hypothetical protein